MNLDLATILEMEKHVLLSKNENQFKTKEGER